MKLWTPGRRQEAKAAVVTARGTIVLRFEYKGKGLAIEVPPSLAVRMVGDLTECLDALEFEARRQGELNQFAREVRS